VLTKIQQLVKLGATVVGEPPSSSPSLQNYPVCDQIVKKIAAELWGADEKGTPAGQKVGKGMVYSAAGLKTALSNMGVTEDFTFTTARPDSVIEYYHRRTSDTDIYFVANRKNIDEEVVCSFRVDGRIPELWFPDTGLIVNSTNWTREKGRTSVALTLEPYGAVFVVFRKQGNPPAVRTVMRDGEVIEVQGPWTIAFQKNRGAPHEVVIDKLLPLNEHKESGIKYFSGNAVYRGTFQFNGELGEKMFLDLGEVGDIAEVTLNGTKLGVLWKSPFRADITKTIKQGENELLVEVVNRWINRMIGDEVLYPNDTEYNPVTLSSSDQGEWNGFEIKGLPDWFKNWDEGKGNRPTGRITFSTVKFFSAQDPLVPAGLIGPVRIITANSAAVK